MVSIFYSGDEKLSRDVMCNSFPNPTVYLSSLGFPKSDQVTDNTINMSLSQVLQGSLKVFSDEFGRFAL
jgi:hypothetical protein